MSTRYDDRDDEHSRRNYGRRSGSEYDRSYGQSTQGGYGRMFDDESERYSSEDRWRGQYGYGGSQPFKEGGEYQTARGESRGEFSSGGWADRDYSSERNRGYGRSGRGGYSGGEYGGGEYGGRGYGGSEWRSGESTSGGYSQRYNYPSGYRSGERYGERYGERGRGQDYGRGGGYGEGQERGWWDRASDEVASWFGDEEAERRRRMDEQRPYRGRGPKGYKRSDERIKEDINDRLSEGYIDATEIEVVVQGGEVTLTGTVNSRSDKRRAEDIAEDVSGVTNVENRIRVKDRSAGSYPTSHVGAYGSPEASGMTGTGTTGARDTGASGSTGSTSTSARGRSAGGGS
jgi:osmotically-inducible protein OsmY